MSLHVLDLEASAHQYTKVVGLRVTGRRDEQVYLQTQEAQDHHCLILNQADRAGILHAGFKASDVDDLDEVFQAAEAWRLSCRRTVSAEFLGQGEGVMITLPSGHDLNLFYHTDKVGYSQGMHDPDIVMSKVDGITPVTHLDHALFVTCRYNGKSTKNRWRI